MKEPNESMPSFGLITDANCKEAYQKVFEGTNCPTETIQPMWEEEYREEYEGFMPKSKTRRAKRLAQKKANDHEEWRLKELDKELQNLWLTDRYAYRRGRSQFRKELELLVRSTLKGLDKPFPESRQKSGKQVLMDYYESVAQGTAELLALIAKDDEISVAMKNPEAEAMGARILENFYRAKKELTDYYESVAQDKAELLALIAKDDEIYVAIKNLRDEAVQAEILENFYRTKKERAEEEYNSLFAESLSLVEPLCDCFW